MAREAPAHEAAPPTPDWSPFCVDNSRLVAPRPIFSPEGVGDRLRSAAFAEVQAELAFLWAADRFTDVLPELKNCWRELAVQERKHREWLTQRMHALAIPIEARSVSDVLWHSLARCPSSRDFCHYMAGAEERGRRAGARFCERLRGYDPETAAIFGRIADEEQTHIDLAYRFFPRS